MECRAVGRYIGIPPRKARLVVDLIRGRGISQALDTMRYTKKYAARVIEKILKSALANAQHNHGAKNIDRLVVKEAFVDQGPTIKRFRPRAMGRANPIKKRSSHITIVLTEKEAAL
ncbi:50S ribosomal protein L22 [Candidatus Methylomirabilis lanthanidiphila]|uniref:Large ribosomal subunit protein uL22 n=1 Tax=Candidatus Methylomirabilis lanthanidiphila TaxID=2211376 RepID=A0A564ZGZ9_9BACT|nr:50S ribosomal protein L22 [Candidatus Methylomirabilis lanthanidiphila]VUZ84406.1 50S ribosomal protein L22 [Candidatus Methylomirabilis lanthanidiphila]